MVVSLIWDEWFVAMILFAENHLFHHLEIQSRIASYPVSDAVFHPDFIRITFPSHYLCLSYHPIFGYSSTSAIKDLSSYARLIWQVGYKHIIWRRNASTSALSISSSTSVSPIFSFIDNSRSSAILAQTTGSDSLSLATGTTIDLAYILQDH